MCFEDLQAFGFGFFSRYRVSDCRILHYGSGFIMNALSMFTILVSRRCQTRNTEV